VFSVPRRPPRSTPFPYTTLFRSHTAVLQVATGVDADGHQGLLGAAVGHHDLAVVAAGLGVDVSLGIGLVRRRGGARGRRRGGGRSEEHTSELQSRENLVCRLLLE